MLHKLIDWTLAWAASPQAEWALFLIAFAESSFFPIPPDILLIAMAVAASKNSFIFATICTAGSLSGAILGYKIGQFGGQPLLKRFVKEENILRVESLFNKYDAWSIIIAGFTPIPYKVFTIASGAFKINFKTFMLSSLIGRGSRFFLVATLFYFWGAPIKAWIEKYFNWLSIIVMVFAVVAFVVYRLWKKRHHKDNDGKLGGSNNLVDSDNPQS